MRYESWWAAVGCFEQRGDWSAEGPSSGSNSVASSGSSSESESTSGNSSVPLAGSGCGHLHADALSREPH